MVSIVLHIRIMFMEDIMKNTLLLASALSMLACVDTGKETGTDTGATDDTATTDTGSDTGTIEYVDPTPTVTWGDNNVTLTITDADSDANYQWGIAETAVDCQASCGDDQIDNKIDCEAASEEWREATCWTGEDCHRGFTGSNSAEYRHCHPLRVDKCELTYGSAIDAITNGTSTLFTKMQDNGTPGDMTDDVPFEDRVTYVLNDVISTEDGSCWVWGLTPAHYADFAPTGAIEVCVEM
jgi:hypothetical protein